MTYISSNQKKKIPNAILEQNKQENKIFLQEWVKGKIDNQITSVNPSNTVISNANLNSDWILVTPDVRMAGTVNEINANWVTWRVEFGEINLNYLEFFKAEFVTKNGTNGDGDSTAFSPAYTFFTDDREFYKFWGWDIKDLPAAPTSNVKTVALVASYYHFNRVYTFPAFESKLLIQYCNQSILV
jgi:hypothetical protein